MIYYVWWLVVVVVWREWRTFLSSGKKTEIRFWQKGRMTSMEEMEMNIILNIDNQALDEKKIVCLIGQYGVRQMFYP
jgi:translation initiation factor IF-3